MIAYLQLVRLPTVFTAMADILLGYVLTHPVIVGPSGWDNPAKFVGLLAASCGLYLAGMVFNDVFDRKQDAAERFSRPIPSGRVSLVSAILLGSILMIVGVAAAATVTRVSLQVAALLAMAILAYDGLLKRTPLAPLAMGLCRSLNVMLGASDQEFWIPFLLRPPQTYVAAFLGLYIVGVTLFARTEARTSNRWVLGLALLILDLAVGCLAWLICLSPMGAKIPAVLAMLTVIALTLNRRAVATIVNPSSQNVQLTIKLMLLSYVLLDATLVFWKMSESGTLGAIHAILTAALVIPALLLSRMIAMT